jgi:hypothetical protein
MITAMISPTCQSDDGAGGYSAPEHLLFTRRDVNLRRALGDGITSPRTVKLAAFAR